MNEVMDLIHCKLKSVFLNSIVYFRLSLNNPQIWLQESRSQAQRWRDGMSSERQAQRSDPLGVYT